MKTVWNYSSQKRIFKSSGVSIMCCGCGKLQLTSFMKKWIINEWFPCPNSWGLERINCDKIIKANLLVNLEELIKHFFYEDINDMWTTKIW